jgi:hypothetical protein
MHFMRSTLMSELFQAGPDRPCGKDKFLRRQSCVKWNAL